MFAGIALLVGDKFYQRLLKYVDGVKRFLGFFFFFFRKKRKEGRELKIGVEMVRLSFRVEVYEL